MKIPEIVTVEEWQQARDALLDKEKALTRVLDALAAERRRLPMVRFENDYVFTGQDGKARLAELFEGRRQLIVYQMMDLGPDEYCNGCSSFVDNIGHLAHLNARDTTFVVVSDMPPEQLFKWRRRMGWTMPFYSSHGTTFVADCRLPTADCRLPTADWATASPSACSSVTATTSTAPTSPRTAASTGSEPTTTCST